MADAQLELRKLWTQHMEEEKVLPRAHDGNMAWIMEWTREDLPLEDPAGSSLYRMYTAEQSLQQNFRADYAPKPPMSVLVFADSYGYCNGILQNAPQGRLGRQLVVTKPPEALTQPEIAQYLKEEKWSLILFGHSIDTPDENTVQAIHAKQDAVTKTLFWIGQELSKNPMAAKAMAVITCDNFTEEPEIHQECGVSLVANATVFGMVNTLRLELGIPIQYIDTEWALLDERMPYLASDVFRSETFGLKSLRILNKGRYYAALATSTKYRMADEDFEGKFKLPEEGIIAITGGNGALGLVKGTWLLKKAEEAQKAGRPVKFSIQFLSRSMKVSEENMPNWMFVQELAGRLGISVEQAKLDMGSQETVKKYLEEITPNLAGIVHSAGILRDGMTVNQKWENFEAVFDGKNRAALYIHDALETLADKNPHFSFFWLFSSMSSLGNMGQVNYSGSNSWNDALARHRRALKKPIAVMQWGAWGEVGMAAREDEHTKARWVHSPQPPFSTADGLKGLEQGLSTGVPVFLVCDTRAALMAQGLRDDSSHLAQYTQIFWSEAFPTSPPSKEKIDETNIYKLISYMGKTLHPEKTTGNKLVYEAYCKQHLESL